MVVVVICHYCKQSIEDAVGCSARIMARPDGRKYERVPFGEENIAHRHASEARCINCQATIGMMHHPGCVSEECPDCHRPRVQCHCPLMIVPESADIGGTGDVMSNGQSGREKERAATQKLVLEEVSWHPSDEQREAMLAAAKLGWMAGCWQRANCRITIEGDKVRHEHQEGTEVIPRSNDEEVAAQLRKTHES